jgi:hypothetical protein
VSLSDLELKSSSARKYLKFQFTGVETNNWVQKHSSAGLKLFRVNCSFKMFLSDFGSN